jgi:hypothetical protein
VDEIDRRINMGQSGSISPFPIDHLRFLDGSANDPANSADFSMKTRELRPNFSAITDFISSVASEAIENLMSTGAFTGDGRQASHWKDDGLTGIRLGIMDPSLPAQQAWTLSDADVRALDLLGYDIVMATCTGVNNCSGHGTCVGLNICTCNSGWSGPACSVGVDCNGNGIEDTFETNNGIADDCNDNNVPDDCEPDTDNDGIPNGCDACAGGATSGDSDGNGIVTLADYTKLAQCFLGPGQASFATGCECFRIDGDNDVDLRDFAKFQDKW